MASLLVYWGLTPQQQPGSYQGRPLPQQNHLRPMLTLVKTEKELYTITNRERKEGLTHMFRNSKKILKKYNVLTTFQKTLRIGRRRRELSKDGIQRPRGAPKHVKNIKEKVRRYLEEDINSRIKAEKKETIIQGSNFKVKKQKRIVNDTLRNLHSKFYAE